MQKQNIIALTGISGDYDEEKILVVLKPHGPKTIMIKGNTAFVEFTQPAGDKLDLLDIEFDDRKIPDLGNAVYTKFDESIHSLPNMEHTEHTESYNIGSGGFVLQEKKEHDQDENSQTIANEDSNQGDGGFILGGQSEGEKLEEELRQKEEEEMKLQQELQKIEMEKAKK